MSTVVNIDEKGRIILPKEIRKKAGIKTPGRILVFSKNKKVEIVPVSASLDRAMSIASIKLRDWKEDKHKGEKVLLRMKR